ncbi:two-component system response regulator [Pacificimonas flava]|uniref:Two-component system response regulator n=2 Tax=Pacificimonas TaxID=1960290 RepID=A0A219B130_9SPHN|nr:MULTISPECIES: response regulator [Pacificimonas]MBZ6378333.1 response regulator [Pacificimonas aurantium]OWV32062.1 two-component system response regulator [Pacificimonas flava]
MQSCLIVDDSKVIRKVARRILEDFDFSIDEAGDGQQALERCGVDMPDVIFLDWNMPVMGGLQFLEHLRARETEKRPTVIFCTTENDLDHIRIAMDAGADEYIMKPFDRDIIRTKLQQVGLI